MGFGLILNQLIWGLLVGVSYSLLAIGFSVIYSTSEAINFAQGEYGMLGAYICFSIFTKFNLPFLLAVLAALVLLFLFGAAVERIAFRRLYKLDAIYVVICTIGLSVMLKNLVLIIWGPDGKSIPLNLHLKSISFFGVSMDPKNLILLVVGIVVMVVFHLFMTTTKPGTAMRAVAQNKGAASLVGINVRKSINLSWGLGALIAAIGGILIGLTYSLSVEMGTSVGIKGFAGAILGGFGNVVGAMFGGAIIGLAETLGGLLISYYYKDLITFAVIIIILVVKPSGIFIKGKSFRKI